jgi:heme/copper-type cytochrome/quinol oxidase subunit 4
MNVEELKQLQSQIIKKNKICNIVGLLLFLIALAIYLSIAIPKKTDIYLMIIISFIELIFCLIIVMYIKSKANDKDIEKFYKEFKNVFVLKSLNNIFTDIKYYPEKGFSKSFIKNIGMLYTGDSYNSNDYISGKYKDIAFEQSDIHIEEKYIEEDADGEKEEVWKTIFLGRLMIFDFNKPFKTNIQVASYRFEAESLPWSKKFSRVEMEDAEFNNTFNVYAESEHEAFYVLTPHFMEKLKTITKKINCGIMFCFVDNKLHIAVDNEKDSFEYNVFEPIDEIKIEKEITNDIKLITDFIDELNLDNELFKK